MSTPLPQRYEAPFRACMDEAAKRGVHLMDQLAESARRAMQQRGMHIEALRLLLQHRTQLLEQFPDALMAEVGQALSGEMAKARPGELSFDSLELMGEDQVQESVEVLRAQQATQQAVESVLGGFNALICTAQGFKTVQADRNPLRPEIYVRALRTVIAGTGVSVDVRLTWMLHFGEALGPLLAADYAYLSDMLRGQGVTAAGFSVVNIAPTIVVASPPATATAIAGAQRAESLLTVRQLHRLLAGELDAGRDSFDVRFSREFEANGREFPVDFSPTLPAAFEALQEMKQVDQVVQRLAGRKDAPAAAAPAGSGAALREELRRQASPGQALGLEVVGLMVDNIAQDPRLLPEVQQAVRELEPALLRLAVIDPRFFSDKRHPARRLLEQLTQRSLGWASAASPGFAAFIAPALEAVQALVGTRIEGAEPFAFALQSLEEVWDEQQKLERRKREKAVRTLVQAEQRNMLAEKIATELRQRAVTAGAPRGISYFVAGPWAQVIAQARLADTTGHSDPGGYQDLVTDLLWSVIPGVAATNPARLARLIPGLLDKLREGLESIGYSRSKSGRFFEELMTLHARASQTGDAAAGQRASAGATHDEDTNANVWLAPSEIRQSGFVETQFPTAQPRPLFEETRADFDETQVQSDQPAQTAPAAPLVLAPGAWIELRMDTAWVRTQLTWASPHGTLFMFTNGDGVNQSMTRQSLDRLVATGDLRVLAGQAVVDGALDAVAQTALRNSLDLTL